MKIVILETTIEGDTTAFTRLSPEEQAAVLHRCNADSAVTELSEESMRRWSRSERRCFFALLFGAVVFGLLFLSSPLWLFVLILLGWLAAWYTAEWWLWYRWYKPRWLEVVSKVVHRELERLIQVREISSQPTA